MSPKQVQMLSLCREAYGRGRSTFLDNRLVARKMALADGTTQISLHFQHDPAPAMYLALFDPGGQVARFVDCSGGRVFQFFDDASTADPDETVPMTPKG